MFDLPNSPTTGQTVTNGGITYRWDGAKWVSAATAYGPSSTTPLMDGVANVGTEVTFARGDHRHPIDGANTGRNLIHNSMFNVQQRGAGPWTANGQMTADRWAPYINLDTASFTIVSLTDADRAAIGDEEARYALQNIFVGSGSAGAQNQIFQNIEDVRRLGGKTVTISFWAKASTGTPSLVIGTAQTFGTGGSPSAPVYNSTFPVTISTTWARYSVTTTLASTSGKTLGTNNNNATSVSIYYSVQGTIPPQSNTVQIWGVQLEIGSVATPLEKLDVQVDLANCQRFTQSVTFVNYGYNGAGLSTAGSTMLPVKMRASPTLTLLGSMTASNLTDVSAGANTEAVWWSGNVSVAGGYVFITAYLASADL